MSVAPVETNVAVLQSDLHGEVVTRSHELYDELRALYNGMIDKKPQYIIRCHDVADVIAAVNFARESDLRAAIRSGGHNGAGLASVNDGVMIDLSPMKSVRVDPKARTVRVGAGATWGDVDHACRAFGLAVPTGIISTTGVSGLALGGGHGYLTRKYGLTCDNLLEADVVLADGSFVTADEQDHADLFWALRGGGGNFGIVTSFKFRAHPVDTVVGGPMLWDIEDGPAVLDAFDKYVSEMDEDTYGFFAYLKVPPGPPFPEELHYKTVCGIVWCHFGTEEAANQAFDVMRSAAKPAFGYTGSMPLPMLNSMFDALYPPGLQWYWKGDFFDELTPEAQRLFQEYGEEVPTLLSSMHMYPINGAPQRKPNDATAFSYRDAKYSVVYVGVDADAANAGAMRDWARDYWDALNEHSMGGAYVNFMFHDEGEQRIKNTYRDNYARLVEVKTKYDPDNFFNVNQNIKPSG